jgi:hypothetical protein
LVAHRGNPQAVGATASGAIVGRDLELEVVATFLAAPPPATLLLQGPAGIGKTTVWRAGVERARADGHRVLLTRPLEVEAASSFAGLGDLLGELYDEAAGELPPPQQAALGRALLRVMPTAEEARPSAVSAGALGLLRTAASDGPVLIAIDDLQWLDGSTAATLRFALRRLEAAPVRVLASARAEGGNDGVQPIGEAVTRLPLGPLGLAELARLTARELGRPLPRPVMRRIERMAAGNAFIALELARAASTRGSSETLTDQALSLNAGRRLAAERLATLPELTVHALAAVAALARPSTALVAGAVADEGLLDPAFRAGVLEEGGGEVRFAHPLLAAAALAALTPRERRALHARLAGLTDDAEARGRHLAAATVEPDAAAAAALDAGAAVAIARGAPAAAAELCEHAARFTPSSRRAERGARLLQAGRHHRAAADARRALQLFRRASETLPAGSLRAEALVAVACHEQIPSREGLVLGRQALAQCGDDRAARARCLAEFARRLEMAGDWRGARGPRAGGGRVARHDGGYRDTRVAPGIGRRHRHGHHPGWRPARAAHRTAA